MLISCLFVSFADGKGKTEQICNIARLLIAFIFQAMACASNLTYYICRPFGGLFGDGVSMFLGLLIRIVEVAMGAVCIGLSILTFFA